MHILKCVKLTCLAFGLAALLVLLSSSVLIAQPGTPTITHMGNGLTVILLEDHVAPVVGIDVWVGAGSSNEAPANSGLSHFIEHLLFGATLKRQAGDMDEEMESLGATLDARTSRDWAHFSTTVSSRYLPKALDVLADAVINAQFNAADVERERLVLLDELANKSTDPIKVCKDYLARELYGSHPYALPVEGSSDNIKKISRDDIVKYHSTYYVPKNMAVVLVGDIDPQTAVSEVGKVFQSLKSDGPAQPAVQPVNPPTGPVKKSFKEPFKIDFVGVAFLGPLGKDYQDVCATDVLLSYMGMGPHSWMADELKAKMGLAEFVNTDFLTQRGPGMISLVAGAKEGCTEKVTDAMLDKAASLAKEGIPQPALDLAKRSLLGQSAFQYETCSGLASAYGFYYTVSEADFASKYLACVQSVTNEDIMRIAGKYMNPANAAIVTIGQNQGGAE